MRLGTVAATILLAGATAVALRAQDAAAPDATPPGRTPGEWTGQGIELYKARRYAEAKTILGKAVALDSSDAAAHAYLGLVLNNLDRDLDGAAGQLEEAVRLDPGNADYHQWLGGIYSGQAQAAGVFKAPGLAKKSLREFETAVKLAPNDVTARLALLQFYLQAPGIVGGSVDKARDQALAITGLDRYQGLLAQALIAEHEKDPGRAEQLYRSAIAAFPGEGDAYNQLGYLLLGTKRKADAIETFRAYVAARPAEANPHDSLAEALLAAGKVDESIAEYQRALAIDGSFSSSYLGLANCYERKGEWQQARSALERFLELVPNGARADGARDRLAALAAKAK